MIRYVLACVAGIVLGAALEGRHWHTLTAEARTHDEDPVTVLLVSSCGDRPEGAIVSDRTGHLHAMLGDGNFNQIELLVKLAPNVSSLSVCAATQL